MKRRLEEMKGGWFVGKFEPSCLSTDACEVAVKKYRAGEVNPAHYHKISTELTLVTSGRVQMNGVEYGPGDIVSVLPGEVSDFVALEESAVVVVKVPAAPDDKYVVEPERVCQQEAVAPMAIKAVIFDLDGVLVDATEWHYEALNRALQLFGYSISRYEHVTSYNGLPTKKKLEMLTCEKGLPRKLHGVLNQVKQVFTQEEILMKCRPTFAKEYMIHRLEREGYRLVVCSNSKRDSLDLMLRGIGVIDRFEFTLSADDVPAPKPSPEIYLKAIARLGLKPEEVMIVEDSPHGIDAARASGAHVCVVRGCHDVHYERLRGDLDRFSAVKVGVESNVKGVQQTTSAVNALGVESPPESISVSSSTDEHDLKEGVRI